MSSKTIDPITHRLDSLETRFAFQEDLVQQLDDVIRSQADQIDRLEREVLKIRTELTHETEQEAPPEEQVPPTTSTSRTSEDPYRNYMR